MQAAGASCPGSAPGRTHAPAAAHLSALPASARPMTMCQSPRWRLSMHTLQILPAVGQYCASDQIGRCWMSHLRQFTRLRGLTCPAGLGDHMKHIWRAGFHFCSRTRSCRGTEVESHSFAVMQNPSVIVVYLAEFTCFFKTLTERIVRTDRTAKRLTVGACVRCTGGA